MPIYNTHLVYLHELREGPRPLNGHLDDVCRRRHGCQESAGCESRCLTPLSNTSKDGSSKPANRKGNTLGGHTRCGLKTFL